MRNLTTAIMTKLSGSALDTAIGGRLYDTEAPQGAEYPYVVYLIVSDVADPVFAQGGEDVLLQFSIFSSASSSGEVKDLYANLKTLYDDCALTITGNTLIWFKRESAGPVIVEDHTTPAGTQRVWHLPVEYRIMTQES